MDSQKCQIFLGQNKTYQRKKLERETAGNWPEEILKWRTSNHLITCYIPVWSYITFTSSYDLMPSSSPSAGMLHHRRADISGWEYSSSTNSLGIQTVPTHWLLQEKNLGWEENWQKKMVEKLFSIRTNSQTTTQILSQTKPSTNTVTPSPPAPSLVSVLWVPVNPGLPH